MRSDLPRGVLAAQVVHAAGESGPAKPGTYAVVLGAPSSEALGALSERLDRFSIKHHKVVEAEGEYAGCLLAIGIPPQPKARIKKALSSVPLLR